MDRLDYKTRLQLIRFACAMAWADLTIQPEEREYILSLMEALKIERPEDREEVHRWLKGPPPPEAVDPLQIPRSAREVFLEECAQVMHADRVVREEESEALELLRRILFGEEPEEKGG